MIASSWRTRWSRLAKAAATSQAVATARAPERRNGPCRVQPPRSPTGTDEGKGPGEGRMMYCTAVFRKVPSPRRLVRSSFLWVTTTWKRQPPCGQHHWTRCGPRWGTSGTVAAASSSFSMSQCRRWVVNWWKCRTSCLRSSSRTFTFQFVVVGVPKFLVEEFKVYAQDRVQHFSSSHPRRQCLNRLRQWWSTSHMRRQCFQRQRQ